MLNPRKVGIVLGRPPVSPVHFINTKVPTPPHIKWRITKNNIAATTKIGRSGIEQTVKRVATKVDLDIMKIELQFSQTTCPLIDGRTVNPQRRHL
jgi:hypothetical protein